MAIAMTSPAEPQVLAPSGLETADWTVRALVRRHKLAAAVAAAFILITAGTFVAAVIVPRNGAVGDSTSCLQWGSSSQTQQQAFGELYLARHGNVAQQVPGVAGVENAVDAGCLAAFSSDEEDSVTVLDAIEKRY